MSGVTVRKAVVPVAGIGSRLLPLTKAQPKEMLPLGRKPVLQYVVEELAAADIRQILLITGRRKRSVEDHFDEDGDLSDFPDDKVPTAERLGVVLSYLRQPRPLGSGHAVWLAKTFTDDEPFPRRLRRLRHLGAGERVAHSDDGGNFSPLTVPLPSSPSKKFPSRKCPNTASSLFGGGGMASLK
jgi:hypothetical protein